MRPQPLVWLIHVRLQKIDNRMLVPTAERLAHQRGWISEP